MVCTVPICTSLYLTAVLPASRPFGGLEGEHDLGAAVEQDARDQRNADQRRHDGNQPDQRRQPVAAPGDDRLGQLGRAVVVFSRSCGPSLS